MIRQMTEKDIREVHNVALMSFTDPWSENLFRQSVASENDYALVWEDEDTKKIAGFAILTMSIGTADITDIAVAKKYRKQGIADKLLKELLAHGSKKSITEFALEVRSSNEAAIRLYQKNGFVLEGIRKNYYRNPVEDACIMWKRY